MLKKYWNQILLSPEERMKEDLLHARTPYDKLVVAAEYGNLALAEELLQQGVNINPDPSAYVATPLYVAVINCKFEMVKFLIGKGANVNQISRPHLENTPLQAAICRKDLDIFAYLLEQGADVNAKAWQDRTALHDAAALAEYDMALSEKFILRLLAAGANIHQVSVGRKPVELGTSFIKSSFIVSDVEKLKRIARLKELFSPAPAKTVNATNATTTLVKQSALFHESKIEENVNNKLQASAIAPGGPGWPKSSTDAIAKTTPISSQQVSSSSASNVIAVKKNSTVGAADTAIDEQKKPTNDHHGKIDNLGVTTPTFLSTDEKVIDTKAKAKIEPVASTNTSSMWRRTADVTLKNALIQGDHKTMSIGGSIYTENLEVQGDAVSIAIGSGVDVDADLIKALTAFSTSTQYRR